MNEHTIQDVPSQPGDILRFPDFILGAMARRGIGSLEAALTGVADEPGALVPWQYCSRTHQTTETIAQIRLDHFRTYLARFATFCGINHYSAQTTFAVQWPISGSPVTHRFSIFLCNEPTMAFWIRIYLYCIDGIYPTPK